MPTQKKILVTTSGGDCPGLNAVIRAIVRKSIIQNNWEVIGCMEAFNGLLRDPMELKLLDLKVVSGIHVRGGTIIGTTNRGGPFSWPVRQPDGSFTSEDRSEDLLKRIAALRIDAVINIGGDGSQAISQKLFEMGLPIIGVPKTIDNDLSSTDFTFGYQTAVEIATDALDKLVTTAESHNRLMILEVMGRDAGWIALAAAIAGGAEIALIPEIPFHYSCIVETVRRRMGSGRGFVIVVVAEGAYPADGEVISETSTDVGYHNPKLGGIGRFLAGELKRLFPEIETRVSVLGHLQRGGSPCSFDRILATQFGIAAVDLVEAGKFGHMVAYRHPDIINLPIKEAIAHYNFVGLDSSLVHTARGLGICLGE